MITMGTTQHEEAVLGAHWLVEMDFSAATVYMTTAPVDVTVGATTYTGIGSQLAVSGVAESEDTAADRITISVPVVDVAMLAAVLGPAGTYRGRAVRLKLQLFDDTFAPVGSPVPRWAGYMDPVKVTRKAATPEEGGTGSGRIEMPCSRAGMARARNYQGLRHTNAQQLVRYPGDRGLEYMQALIEAPALWLSKKFQEQR